MSHDKDVLNRFLINTANHTMKVHRDDGIYRHLEFSRNGSNSYRFDLVTWPGYLCVTGDMGTWTFSRITDMFDFFTASHFGRQESFLINPGYWSEKFESGAGRGRRESPCFEFDAQAFDRGLQQWLPGCLKWKKSSPPQKPGMYVTAGWSSGLPGKSGACRLINSNPFSESFLQALCGVPAVMAINRRQYVHSSKTRPYRGH